MHITNKVKKMRKIPSKDSTCGSKDAHPTAAAARKSVKGAKRSPKGYRIEVYKCPYCGKYHIGKRRVKSLKNIPGVR